MNTPDWLKLTSAALESTFDAILILDIVPGQPRILYANPAAERLTGYPKPDLEGHNPRMLESENISQQIISEVVSNVRSNLPYQCRAQFKRKDGSTYWAELSLSPIDIEPQGRYWISTHRDLSSEMRAQEALKNRDDLYQLILNNSPGLYRMYNREGRCVYASAASERMLGYAPNEMVGMSFDLLHPEDHGHLTDADIEEIWQGKADYRAYEYRVVHRSGRTLWVSSTMRVIGHPEQPGERLLLVVTEDITSRKKAQQEAREQNQRYTSLLELKYRILLANQPLEVAEEAIKLALPLTEYEFGFFISFQEENLHLEAFHGANPEVRQQIEHVLARNTRATVLQLLEGTKPLFIGAENTRIGKTDVQNRKLFRAFALLPIHADGEVYGAISFVHRGHIEVSPSTQRLLGAIEERVSLAYSKLVDIQRLEASREETMRTLGLALEYRDYETKGHTDRVIELCQKLGEGVGLDEETLKELRWGAYLHDIGKIATPDAVLLKPGKLDPEEWAIIKQHPVVGFELTRSIPSLPERTLDIVLHHQERWNGSGYPEGLSGKTIPFLARLFAVVDVYDALTSERPYKKAFSHEAAISQLWKEAGTLLDPELVQVFVQVMTEPVPEA
ncbi:HD domain-containing phosphohydrolase [Deinococcus misasensis]|uniref:HD domain-containing phosphohydrolase n=1 Tax=Deinococcus misasensis TaxID=392413 RepID=UPI0012F791D9|nr:HD domain-containing phosphohydrolase [Deinococcus misasensis]